MKYILRKSILANVPEVEITKKNYLALQQARRILTNALAIEEKYEILISNYLEFEKEISDITTSHMLRNHLEYSAFFDVQLGLNVRLVNLLTSARMYVDQLNQHVRECLPNQKNVKTSVKGFFAKEYDDNPEYRFMETLRNYVQHRGLPVHSTSQGGSWTELGRSGFLEYSTELFSQRALLAEDGEFKKAVLSEIDDKIDLKVYTRCYVESISNVHDAARKMIEESVHTARKLIEGAHEQYKTVYNESLAGLSACIISEEQQFQSIPLLLDWDDIRIMLQKRNKKATNLKRRYVTGKAKSHNHANSTDVKSRSAD